jgi:RNA polymerase sigma-70 factor (sigma-E family)
VIVAEVGAPKVGQQPGETSVDGRGGPADPAGGDPAGRDEILAAVYRTHARRLVGLARLLLDDATQSEEVVQEAFARTYAGWSRLRRPDDPLPYVQRAVVNLARGGLRRRVRARAFRPERTPDVPSAEHSAALRERGREVAAAVRTLPRRQRECVVLRYYLDCSVHETAQALRISDGSVKQHLHRAHATLADRLGEQEVDD